MSRVFLCLVMIVVVVALFIVGATLCASYDHLKKFVPEGGAFYFHLNFNSWNSQGHAALEYFSSAWPTKPLNQLLTGDWAFVKNNFNPAMLERIEEASLALINNQPVMLLKYKLEFNNFRPLNLNPDKTKNYYRLLRPDVIAFAADPKAINDLAARQIDLKDELSLMALKNFITGYIQNWSISATIEPGLLTWQAQTKNEPSRQNLSAKVSQFINLMITQDQDSSEEYVYVLTDQKNYQSSQIQDLIQKSLVCYFPRKIIKTLPDQTQVTELIADPQNFTFDKIKINNDNVYILEKNAFWPDLIFSVKGKQVFLSNNQELLQQFLSDQTTSLRPANNLEIFYWQNQTMVIKGALPLTKDPGQPIIINGSVTFR